MANWWTSFFSTFFLIFEEMRGGSLQAHIKARAEIGSCLNEVEARLVTADVTEALRFLHLRGEDRDVFLK